MARTIAAGCLPGAIFCDWGGWDEARHARHVAECWKRGGLWIIDVDGARIGMIQLLDQPDAVEIGEDSNPANSSEPRRWHARFAGYCCSGTPATQKGVSLCSVEERPGLSAVSAAWFSSGSANGYTQSHGMRPYSMSHLANPFGLPISRGRCLDPRYFLIQVVREFVTLSQRSPVIMSRLAPPGGTMG